MRIIDVLQIINLIFSSLIIVYILIDVKYKKNQLQQGIIDKVNNNKYVILISLVILLFFIYGISRNFQ